MPEERQSDASRIAELERQLKAAEKQIGKLKNEINSQRIAAENRNREVDTLGRVWCSGGCWGGMDRYRKDGPPNVTGDQIAFLLRNAYRAYAWYINFAGKQAEDKSDLSKIWDKAKGEVVTALLKQHDEEIEELNMYADVYLSLQLFASNIFMAVQREDQDLLDYLDTQLELLKESVGQNRFAKMLEENGIWLLDER